MEENLKELLNLVKDVCEKNRQYKKGFNVITTFVKPHREVELHSRFITWLLDPKGPHGLGTLPLELFLKQLNSQFGVKKNVSEDRIEVVSEVVPNASNWTEDREMDILIKGLVNEKREESAIIIENKIYAKDSDKGENNGQLARYLLQVETGRKVKDRHLLDSTKDKNKYFTCKHIELFYLTLDGHEPEEKKFTTQDGQSATIEDKYKKITYLRHIEPWLNEIILNIYNCEEYSQTIEIIQQYLDALHCVSPNVKLNQELFAAIEKKESLIKTLKKFLEDEYHNDWIKLPPEKIEEKLKKEKRDEYKIDEPLWATAIFLLKNHKHLYWHALAAFFDDLSRELEEQLKPLGVTKVEHPKNLAGPISNIIHQRGEKKKEHPYWVFWYNGVWWTIQLNEISQRFFFGVDRKHKENKRNLWEEKPFNEEWWLLEDLMPIVNPWDFTQGQTFDLLNEKKRQEIAQQYAKFVKQELAKG